ncbi:MAG: deoxyguanosinetriphosphate triphosphohydrolase [Actinobacteria bacterium]|nr:deoxyguanosinetriphosphate triphosphohydrolase [Actinomycetota bacterium]MBI3687768.1 deoxyguanosinetriphosphate triphosphohydrolase [Actinomycetota bacterium]
MAVYDDHDRARWSAERPKRAGTAGVGVRPARGDFERDRARVLHSSALRRLAGKTQVVAPGEDDFPRTRLTHSLEVAQIGREIGAALGCDPDIVDAAGLAHDLGHPPFGHNGEDALDAVAGPCGGFEGNAQTLRVLTRLEAKIVDGGGRPAGLNLTRATLDATCKYPWPRRPGSRKFGVYDADRPAYDWVRDGAPADRRSLEAQVMDWADDVAYSVHDLEDGIYAGHIRLSRLADPDERAALVELVAQTYSPERPADLLTVLDELLALPPLADLAGYDGRFGAQVALKRATSEIVGRFATVAVRATRATHGGEPAGSLARHAADLVIPRRAAAECALLKGVALRYVMQRQAAEPRYERQREVLTELVAELARRAPDALEPALRPDWAAATDDAGRLRVVIDQVARLTDASAWGWHARLTGRG